MTHVVTARCVNCRYTDCVAVCPVDCFYEVSDPHMLVIDPDTCIDCELCQESCPVNAIWPEEELPPEFTEWIDKNRALYVGGENIAEQQGPLANARELEVIQEEEKGKGWQIEEPPSA